MSFPPVRCWPLAWLGLAPFFAAITRVRPARAALLGFVWATLAAYGVASWLPTMVIRYFEQPAWVGWLGAFAVALLASLYYAAFATWISWLTTRREPGPLLIAAGWGLCEYGRATLLVPDPWALSAYSQIDVQRVVQVADLAGPYGIGMLIAAVNVAFLNLTLAIVRTPRWRRILAVAFTMVAVLVYGDWRSRQFADGTTGAQVAVVQGAIERGHRWQPEYQLLGVDRYLELTATAKRDSPALIVWPEFAVSLYLNEKGPGQDAILGTTLSAPLDIILGGPHYEFADGRTVYHNSIFQIRDGRIVRRYDKMSLLPLAEAPLGWMRPTGLGFTPGRADQVFETRAGRVGAFVCWEAMLPDHTRRLARSGAELLANLSNDAWFGSASAAEQHFAMARLRAIEQRRWLLRAASTGISAVVDPRGAVVARADLGVATTLSANVVPSSVVTPYAVWGDAWAIIAAAVVVLGAGAPARRPNAARVPATTAPAQAYDV